MEQSKDPNLARLIPLLVIGISLNTLGIVMTSLGNWRFALMAVGLALILTFLIKVLASRNPPDRSDAP